MKCPICKGNGKIWGDYVGPELQKKSGYTHVGQENDLVDCLHCRSTGEIQKNDVWHIEVRSHIVGTIHYDFKMFDGESFGAYEEFDVIPLFRMEKVQ